MALERCPFCSEGIEKEAAACPHCGKDLPEQGSGTRFAQSRQLAEQGKEYWPITGLTFQPDWVGAQLAGADFSGAALRGANFRGANLSGANLRNVDLREADLTKADLAGADLSKANLSEADLHRVNLTGATLARTNLFRADLVEACLRSANLSRANLSGTSLRESDLREADLSGADLVRTDFSRADLSGARIEQVRDWELIQSVKTANLFQLKDPPEGFLGWAEGQGAVSLKPEEWETLKSGHPVKSEEETDAEVPADN